MKMPSRNEILDLGEKILEEERKNGSSLSTVLEWEYLLDEGEKLIEEVEK